MATGNHYPSGEFLNFNKMQGLIPAIVQDSKTDKVLMLGFMNEEAYRLTCETEKVTFYSRVKERLWTKGEESGHFLFLREIIVDCDNDSLLVKAEPVGSVCHTGADTCFQEENKRSFLPQLEEIIASRRFGSPDNSYTAELLSKGIKKIAQKVGEEAVETILEAESGSPEAFLNESADLVFHLLVLLQAKGYRLEDIAKVLERRHKG